MHGHHQTRCAEPALHGAGIDEGLLHERRRARLVGDALDGHDRTIDRGRAQDEARADQKTVDEHRARTTFALLARVLRTRQTEPLSQYVEQTLAQPRARDVMVGAIDPQAVRDIAHGFSSHARARARCAHTTIAWRRNAAVPR